MPYFRLLNALSTPSAGGIDGPLAAALMPLLVRGEPVRVELLADTLGSSCADVKRRLAAMPETEYDTQGRIVGYVLTHAETPHRFRICDTQMYTWCPLDTVIVPRLIHRTAHVDGVCGSTGTPLKFISAPEGLYSLTHPDAVISLPRPDDVTHLRTAFCRQVRFFISPDAANCWLGANHNCDVLPLHEAFALGATLADRLTDARAVVEQPTRADFTTAV